MISSEGKMGSVGTTVTASAIRGVSGGVFFSSFNRRASRFFSSVRKKTLIVVRNDLLGFESAPATGLCSHTGQVAGSVDWPTENVRSIFL